CESYSQVLLRGCPAHLYRNPPAQCILAVKLRGHQPIGARRDTSKLKPSGGFVNCSRSPVDIGRGLAVTVGQHYLKLASGKIFNRTQDAASKRNRANSRQGEIDIRKFAAFRKKNLRGGCRVW